VFLHKYISWILFWVMCNVYNMKPRFSQPCVLKILTIVIMKKELLGEFLSTLASICLELHVTSVKQSDSFHRNQSIHLLKIDWNLIYVSKLQQKLKKKNNLVKVGSLFPPFSFLFFSSSLSLPWWHIATLVYWTAGKIKKKEWQLKVFTHQC